MSGPKWVRSTGARALLFVCGGWGWLGYRGQTGPSKPGFHHSPHQEEGLESGLHKKPWRTWSSEAGFDLAGYISAQLQIDIYHEAKSTTGVCSFPTQKNHTGSETETDALLPLFVFLAIFLKVSLKVEDWKGRSLAYLNSSVNGWDLKETEAVRRSNLFDNSVTLSSSEGKRIQNCTSRSNERWTYSTLMIWGRRAFNGCWVLIHYPKASTKCTRFIMFPCKNGDVISGW